MPHCTVAGRRLHYERRGEGEPLLLVQGMSGNHLHWGEPFLEALGPELELVAYDHRGAGHSDPIEGDFAIADLADDAAGVLAELGVARAHVLGISMGGMVAQELALRHPERVASLVLGCTMAGGPDTVVADRTVRRRLRDAYATGDVEEVLRAGWEVNVSPGYREAHPDRYAAFREMALSLPAPMALLMRQLGAISRHDTAARLAELAEPTLVVHGTEDRLIPVANGRRLAELVPGARLEILDGVGHLFYWEQPERAAALVREHCLAAGIGSGADAPGAAASA